MGKRRRRLILSSMYFISSLTRNFFLTSMTRLTYTLQRAPMSSATVGRAPKQNNSEFSAGNA